MKKRAYQKVWQYIKIMRYFTLEELHILLTLDNEFRLNFSGLKTYILGLKNFEIIKEVHKDNYILYKDIGLLAPEILNNHMIQNPNNDNMDCTEKTFSTGVLTQNQYYNNNTLFLYNGGNND